MSCSKINFSTANGCTQIDKDYDWRVTCNYTDKDDLPIDLTGYTNSVIIKNKAGDTVATLIDVASTNQDGVYTPVASEGIRIIQLTKDTTTTLTESSYVYEWSQTDSNGYFSLFLYGAIFVDKGSF